MLKPFAYSSITRNDESKAGDVFVDLGSTGFFSLPPPTTLPPHRTVINEQKKPENVLPFIRLTFELFQYPLEFRPVRAFTFLFSDNKITRPPPPVCLPLLSSPHPSSSKQQLHKEAFKIWPGLVYFMSHLFFFSLLVLGLRETGGDVFVSVQ